MENIKGYDISGTYLGSSSFPDKPNIVMRVEKGQALTHAEADFNLGSLMHTASFSESPETYEKEGFTKEQLEKRRLEQAGMYVTVSYAPVTRDGEILTQNKDIVAKIQHSTDEILEKISEETVPGNFAVRDSFEVGADSNIKGNANAQTSTTVGDSSVGRDLHVHGDIYCDGTIYGNISTRPYVEEFSEKEDSWTEEHPRKSDIRLKKDIKAIPDALVKLSDIGGYEFNWIKSEKADVGVIAQEIQKVLPEAVSQTSDGDFLKVDYVKIIPLLIQAIKELQKEVCQLKEDRLTNRG